MPWSDATDRRSRGRGAGWTGSWTDGRCHPQLGQVALDDPAPVAGADQVRDAVEQAGLGCGVAGAMAGHGEEDPDIAGGGVGLLPFVAAEGRGAEPVRPVELLAGAGDVGRGPERIA